jgi:hypothetical protein
MDRIYEKEGSLSRKNNPEDTGNGDSRTAVFLVNAVADSEASLQTGSIGFSEAKGVPFQALDKLH